MKNNKNVVACGLLVLALLVPHPLNADEQIERAMEPTVSSVAGSGELGTRDGSAAQATFIQVAGIAVTADGVIYVTDAGAQTIRRIRGGLVETIAGASTPGATPQDRVGGYLDGPAAQARFNRPLGIAVAKDGALYIADEENHCIRKVKDGVVTTFAGSTQTGSQDGAGTLARFARPHGIAIDDAGNLYVADYGNGVRKITPGAAVSTLSFDGKFTATKPDGIAVRGSGADLIIAYNDESLGEERLYLTAGANRRFTTALTEREPWYSDLHIRRTFGLAILGDDAVVATDLLDNSVRTITFDSLPRKPGFTVRSLGGGLREGALDIGGFADGAADRALFDVPFGIAVAKDGSIFVTDSGNRRVRRIDGVSSRHFVTSDLNNLTFPKNSYRIAVVGDSYMWNDVLWNDSIAGQIEASLNAHLPSIGLTKDAHVDIVEISGLSFPAGLNFVTNYLGDGEADLVIFMTNGFTLGNEPDVAIKAGGWEKVYPQQLQATAAKLMRNRTKLAVAVVSVWPSPLERTLGRELDRAFGFNFDGHLNEEMHFESVLAGSGIKTLGLVEQMEKSEESPERFPMINTNDHHPTIRGSIWIGQHIEGMLADWKPWSAAPLH